MLIFDHVQRLDALAKDRYSARTREGRMLLEAQVSVLHDDRSTWYIEAGLTSLALRIDMRTGNNSRITGISWSSVRSVLTNSVKTCMAP
jgi:hypothetical protein